MKTINLFEDLNCCPFCGNEEFYITNWMQDFCEFNMRFDGEEAADISQMYDVAEGKRAYCNACFKYIGNRETGALSAEVINRLKEMSLYGNN